MIDFGLPVPVMLVIAPFIGSFVALLAVRLPADEPVVLGRSRCPSCNHVLSPRELIPLASWLIQRGRCRACGAPIAAYYPLMEIAAAALVLWAASATDGAIFLTTCGLGWLLLALAAMDMRTMRLSDSLNALLALGGIAATLAFAPDQIRPNLATGAACLVAFAAIGLGYGYWRGRSGLGLGDAKLFGAAGLWVGPAGAVSVLLIASFSGLVAALGAHAMGRKLERDTAIPFGPFIALGLWLVWLYGPVEFRMPA